MVRTAKETRLSPAALAAREDVSLPTVYRWNQLGTGPRYMKLGGAIRYRLDDVIAWEQGSMVGVSAARDSAATPS
jgi:hypothetical protein